jgi:hypothetical protein
MAYLFLLLCIIFTVDQEYWIFSDEKVVYFGYSLYRIFFANLVFIDVFSKFGGQSVAAVPKPGPDLDRLQRAYKHICVALSVTIVLLDAWMLKHWIEELTTPLDKMILVATQCLMVHTLHVAAHFLGPTFDAGFPAAAPHESQRQPDQAAHLPAARAPSHTRRPASHTGGPRRPLPVQALPPDGNPHKFIKNNNFQALSHGLIRRLAAQMLASLRYLHKHKVFPCSPWRRSTRRANRLGVLQAAAAGTRLPVGALGRSCSPRRPHSVRPGGARRGVRPGRLVCCWLPLWASNCPPAPLAGRRYRNGPRHRGSCSRRPPGRRPQLSPPAGPAALVSDHGVAPARAVASLSPASRPAAGRH